MEEITESMSELTVGRFEDPLSWWWAFSRRDIWLAENKIEAVAPQEAWSAACFPFTERAADWLTRVGVWWKFHHGYICVSDPVGPWLRLRMMHYGAPPTSYEPIICDSKFAKIGTAVRPIRRERAEYGRDLMHRSMIKIAGACVLWDLPALISFETAFFEPHAHTYIFTLRSFITIRAKIVVSDCIHIDQEIVEPP